MDKTNYIIKKEPKYNIPTEELLGKFPIAFETPVTTDLEKKIQNRLLNGFNTYNLGYDAWKDWGNVLYYPGSIYNVNSVRLTLEEYQLSQKNMLGTDDIQLSPFKHMIISGEWTAIQYATTHNNRQTGKVEVFPVMEFVRFGDHGEKGAKVEEGWGGVRYAFRYDFLQQFQNAEEKKRQDSYIEGIINTILPETDNLDTKYPIFYPTLVHTPAAQKMKMAILRDFDHWNKGYAAWVEWSGNFLAPEFKYYAPDGRILDREGTKADVKATFDKEQVRRVFIEHLIVSGDYAGIHYWSVVKRNDGFTFATDTMQIMHFVEEGGTCLADQCWLTQEV